jgi:diamine N-acetyltransferase
MSMRNTSANTSNIQFRRAEKKDVKLVLQLLKESAIEQEIEHEFFTTEADLMRDVFGEIPKANIFIVEKGDEIAGITVFFYNFASFIGCAGIYIEDIYIRPAFQGQGLGKTVFQYLAKHAVEQGCGLLEWLVLDENHKAKGFYQKMGAYSVDGWTVNRVKGEALKKMAG